MGDFLAQANLANDTDFLKKVKIATKKIATFVVGEDFQGKEIKGSKRHKLGVEVLTGDMTSFFAEAIVAANANLVLASTDQQIQDEVSNVFNDLAGVMLSEI